MVRDLQFLEVSYPGPTLSRCSSALDGGIDASCNNIGTVNGTILLRVGIHVIHVPYTVAPLCLICP